jgi:hypothetical protein
MAMPISEPIRVRMNICIELAAPAVRAKGCSAIELKLAPMKPMAQILAAITGMKRSSVWCGLNAKCTCTRLSAMQRAARSVTRAARRNVRRCGR